ncbi:MAG TPA: hypothetical protein VFM34_05855 [Moraxellaceae bacterium]|nr:hypothetical protein [Moraxellaceae bacterium]
MSVVDVVSIAVGLPQAAIVLRLPSPDAFGVAGKRAEGLQLNI